MKQKFKRTWNKSVQARKQRKYRYNAPLHTQSKFLHASLSKDLQEKHSRRSLRVRKGDEVEIMRGTFKGEGGVVEEVDTKNYRVVIRGVAAVKLDGSRKAYPVAVSNIRITKLTEDGRRL